MTDRMVNSNNPPRAERTEVITAVQRRRHWTTQEKVRHVEETYLPGQSVSLVARRHGLNANELFVSARWQAPCGIRSWTWIQCCREGLYQLYVWTYDLAPYRRSRHASLVDA